MTEIIKTDKKLVPAQIAEKIIKLEQLKKDVASQLDALKSELLEFTRSNDVYTLKTGTYTISRCKRQTVNVYDPSSVKEWGLLNGYDLHTTYTLTPESEKVVKDLVKKGIVVPNTSLQESEYLTVRIAKVNKK
jgi:hypothetical protein